MRFARGFATLAAWAGAATIPAAAHAISPIAAPAAPTRSPMERWIGMAADIAKRAPKLAAIWPGYWPEDQPYILYARDEGALLVADGPPPEGFVPLSRPDLPTQLRGRLWFRKGSLEGVNRPFIIGHPIGGGRKAMLVIASGDAAEIRTLLFHEQFHGFQAERFKGAGARQFVAPAAIRDRPAFAAAAEAERRALAAALAASGRAQAIRLLREYLAMRRLREAGMEDEIVDVERGFERLEGTAKYVERAAELHFSRGGTLPASLAAELRRDFAKENGPFMTTWFRSRSYGTGAAISHFLDRLHLRRWRTRIEAGEAPDVLLAELVGFSALKDPAALGEAARKRYGVETIRAAIGPAIEAAAAREIKTPDDFYRLGTYRVVVEIADEVVKAAGRPSLGLSSGPGGMVMISQSEVVLPKARQVGMTAAFGSLSVEDRPFMSGSSSGARYAVLLDQAPLLDGKSLPPPGQYRFDRLEVAAPGYRLTLNRPAAVTVTATGLAIAVRD